MKRLTDLRQILHYVPRFRDKVFVIALDGAVVADDNFGNLLLDIALLRSLRIGVVLVHGAGHQIRRLAEQTGVTPSNIDGTGVTDEPTFQLALTAAQRVTHAIIEGLTNTDSRAASPNAVVAHPAGILQGIDHQFTGRVERIDTGLLQALMEHDIVPVIAPVGYDGEGHSFRVNSDQVACEVAKALRAVKLIYLTTIEGLRREGKLVRQMSVEEAEHLVRRAPAEAPPLLLPKLVQAVKATRAGVPRVHILDGRVDEALLAEVFSNEGIGTLIHTNEYQAIRRAQKKDLRGIQRLIRGGVETDELLPRSRAEIERQLQDFFVFEIDRTLVGCVALHFYPESCKAELACLYVDSRSENQGVGVRLIHFVEQQARQGGAEVLLCLSTQAFNYFVQKGGFSLGTPDDLPPVRRERYDRSGRKSRVLVKRLPP